MKILISNDDGINAQGIKALAMAMQELGEVYVVAPERNQSATGHAVTMHTPLRSRKLDVFGDNIKAWWVNGTPADCVKLGVENLMDERPDLLVSGINMGENLGTDVIYSGTVSAAVEGAIFGIPAIAFSYEDYTTTDMTAAATVAKEICKQILEHGIPQNHIFNVNIPAINSLQEIKGIKICKLGIKIYKNNFEERKDPKGNTYYWLAGELVDLPDDIDTDIYAIKNKYISITPINIDLTDYELKNKMHSWKMNW
ncbi:MAG: 5'/3'-nucleotidase SurE [Clostridiales bacterium GWB2_37_7]|nr:MAG: 5'/3'-nucleotidase SurE [Clostridiales bacterium GWB2_37_7]